MTDSELLELAAKAAGLKFAANGDDLPGYVAASNGDWRYGWVLWNPIADDGDALRLAVKMGMFNEGMPAAVELQWQLSQRGQRGPSDPYEDTRRAIVRAAAEIGKEKA